MYIHPRKCPCGNWTFTLELLSHIPIDRPPAPPIFQKATCTQCGRYRIQTISEAEEVGGPENRTTEGVIG